jgi:NAD(P)-dependent dehydrogenase (short-subunit alcohol dehydrogenase family)
MIAHLGATRNYWGANGLDCTLFCNLRDLAETMADAKIAVVTGSSSGIGLLTAIELATSEYRVVATMRDLGRSGRLEEATQKAGVRQRIDLRQLDVTNFDAMPRVVNEIVRDHGRIDVLVNNAGFSSAGFVEDTQLAELRHQMETNFFGAVAMTKAVLPTMRKQRSGYIVQITSVGGRAPAPMLSSYSASKFALEGWSEALRIEVHSLGIRVVLIEPGAYDTDIWERNLVIGKDALSADSPNKERSRRFAEFIKSRAPKRGDAREVARAIVRAVKDPNPKLRYLVGTDAKTQVWFRRLTPWRTYERIMAKATKID